MEAKFLIIISLCLFFYGCKKITGTDGTYTIRGKFLKDCTGEPIANYGIRLNIKNGWGTSENISVDTTDAEGNYEFRNIPLKYREWENRVFHDISWDEVTNWGSGNVTGVKDGDVINWNFYGKKTYNTIAKFTINISNFSSNDTLYIGQTIQDYKFYHPIPLEAIVSFSAEIGGLGRALDTTEGAILWGRNKKDFDSAWDSQLKYHTVHSKYELCISRDTNYFSIP